MQKEYNCNEKQKCIHVHCKLNGCIHVFAKYIIISTCITDFSNFSIKLSCIRKHVDKSWEF